MLSINDFERLSFDVRSGSSVQIYTVTPVYRVEQKQEAIVSNGLYAAISALCGSTLLLGLGLLFVADSGLWTAFFMVLGGAPLAISSYLKFEEPIIARFKNTSPEKIISHYERRNIKCPPAAAPALLRGYKGIKEMQSALENATNSVAPDVEVAITAALSVYSEMLPLAQSASQSDGGELKTATDILFEGARTIERISKAALTLADGTVTARALDLGATIKSVEVIASNLEADASRCISGKQHLVDAYDEIHN